MTQQPPYPHPPQQPTAGWQAPPQVVFQPVVVETAATAWWCSLIVLAFLPGINGLVASLVVYGVGRSHRSRSPLARVNGTRAMNWGLTYLLTTALVWGAMILAAIVPEVRDFLGEGSRAPGMWMMIFWLVHTLVFLIGGIVGALAAGRQKVSPVNGIPFHRA